MVPEGRFELPTHWFRVSRSTVLSYPGTKDRRSASPPVLFYSSGHRNTTPSTGGENTLGLQVPLYWRFDGETLADRRKRLESVRRAKTREAPPVGGAFYLDAKLVGYEQGVSAASESRYVTVFCRFWAILSSLAACISISLRLWIMLESRIAEISRHSFSH